MRLWYVTRGKVEGQTWARLRNEYGVYVLNLRRLCGTKMGAQERERRVRDILGPSVLAEAAWRMTEGLGLTKVLFTEADDSEVAFLLEHGARLAPDGPLGRLFEKSVPGPVFRARCAGEWHRLTLDGLRLVPLDHTEEEIALLEKLGERLPCVYLSSLSPVELHGAAVSGRRKGWASKELADWLRSWSDMDLSAVAELEEDEDGRWKLLLRPFGSGRRAPGRFVLGLGSAETKFELERTARRLVEAASIPWSPVAGVAAALVVNEVAGWRSILPSLVRFEGKAAWT